jgi:hypothetical protein
MATSNNPLAPDPVTDIDGPDVFPPLEPVEDLGAGVPVIQPGVIETGRERRGTKGTATIELVR